MTDNGCWVMLTHKPPTRPSPAKFSLFWSKPANDVSAIARQHDRYYDEHSGKYVDFTGDEHDPDNLPDAFPDLFGLEDNAEKRRIIHFMGVDLAIEAHEYAVKGVGSMRELLFAIPEAAGAPLYELVENSEASKLMLEVAMDTDLRALYDAALLDGCTPPMAQMVAMGQDISSEMFEFPPVGYYRPILGAGYFEMFSDVGEPIRRGEPPEDEYWMLRETPPLSISEIERIGAVKYEMEEERKRLDRLASLDDMEEMANDILGDRE